MGLMVCKVCGQEKSVDDFGYVKTWVRKTCKVCRSEDMRQQRIKNPDRFRGYEYKKKYKINLDTYNKKLEEQGGVCAICKGTWSKVLVIDHDHDCCPSEYTCGKCLRALLCGNCNAGLGWFKHDPDILRSAIEYIETVEVSPWQ